MRGRPIWVAAVVVLLVGSCGGGDDAEVDSTSPPATAAPAPTDSGPTDPGATDPVMTEPEPTEPPPATEPPATSGQPATTAQPTSTAATTTPAAGEGAAAVVCTPVSVATGDTTIEGERCDPGGSDPAPRPAAIVLNGCGGYTSDTEITGATVRALAERGVIALRVDYLDAEPAPPDAYCDAGQVFGAVQPLLTAIVDSVATLRADPAVDPARVGAASYSLGAVAVMAAEVGGGGLVEVAPLGLSAAALLSYPDQLPTIPLSAREGLLPPLFLMTGADDTIAPPAGAQALADAAVEGGVPVELVIVADQGHPWRGDAAVTAAAALADFLAVELGA